MNLHLSFSSTAPSSHSTCCFSDWIPPAVSGLWQCQHHWAACAEHLTHSGQCVFRCSLQHHSVSFKWCWAKQEQSISPTWWDSCTTWVWIYQHTVSRFWISLNLLWFLIVVPYLTLVPILLSYPLHAVFPSFVCKSSPATQSEFHLL